MIFAQFFFDFKNTQLCIIYIQQIFQYLKIFACRHNKSSCRLMWRRRQGWTRSGLDGNPTRILLICDVYFVTKSDPLTRQNLTTAPVAPQRIMLFDLFLHLIYEYPTTDQFIMTFYSILSCLFRGEFYFDHVLLRTFVLPSFVGTLDASRC